MNLLVVFRPESLRFVAGPFKDMADRARQVQLLRWASGAGEPWILVGSADSEESVVKLVKEILAGVGGGKELPPIVSLELYVHRELNEPKGEAKWN